MKTISDIHDKGNQHQVHSPNFYSLFEKQETGLFRMHHQFNSPHTMNKMDVFSDFWAFAIGTFHSCTVNALQGIKTIPLSGRIAFFAPCFSIVEWILVKGQVGFDAWVSNHPLEGSIPSHPIFFPWNDEPLPESIHQIGSILSQNKHSINLSRHVHPSTLSLKAKNLIDQGFQEDLKINDIADCLNVCRESLSRSFRMTFGLAPQQYRNRLRISQSIFNLISTNASITEIGYEVGFQDISRYHKQFKKQVSSLTPSKFRF